MQRFIFPFLSTTFICLILSSLFACSSPKHQPVSTTRVTPSLNNNVAIMADGYLLPLNIFLANNAKASLIALHGFNDYRNAFTPLCTYLAKHNVHCYAYDQRGFGETQHRGLWPYENTLQNDLATMIKLIKDKHPDLPLYIIGESMGGAVVLTTFAKPNTPHVTGISLLAPAVWARHTQPWYQRLALWLTVRIAPGWKPTAKGFERVASDNDAMLRELSKDPLVIKATRVDAIYGLTNLMDQALAATKEVSAKGIVFYGEKDELITKQPTCEMLANISANKINNLRFVLYKNGYHMLSRDLQANKVYQDLITWIDDAGQPLNAELGINNNEWQSLYCSK
ncbi:lysophospholipase [Beggiatoa alba]|nr:lysophospholipase [Beggiatoa alba]